MKKNLPLFAVLVGVGLVLVQVGAGLAQDDLESLLEQVGEEYALAYASPFIEAFGPNQNSAMYQSAHIPWGRLHFGVGLKVMASHLSEDDQTFQKNVRLDNLGDIDPSLEGESGTAVFAGPTIFGDTETNGTITLIPDAGGPPVALEGIPGLVDTRFVPLFAPEAYVGGVFGLRGTVRWLPEIDLSDYGKTKYFGYGLQWSPNGLLVNFPIDVMVGFFDQEMKVGELIDANAKTYFLAASKGLGAVTVYGGFAKEEADMTVSYTSLDTGDKVSFSADASQESRITLGARFGLLSAELAHGKLTTYSAGLMFGF